MGLLDSLLSQGSTPGAPSAPSPLALGLLGNVNSRPKFQTPQDIQRAQLIAQQLQQEGSKYSPIGSWTQGAARVLDTLVGDKQASDASDYASTQRQAAASQFAQLLGGGTPAAPSPLAQGLMGGAAPAASPGAGQQSADLSGGDPTFGRMIGAESGGQQFGADGAPLTSPKGAVGIAQVMPGTAPEAAQYAGLPFDQTKYQTDPAYNAALGKAYFDHQMQQFGGDPAMAAAAYNAGPGAVQQAVAKAQQGGGSYLDYLPAETQAYVAKVAPNGGQQVAPPSSAMAYAPPSGGAQPAPGGAMGAIQSAAGPAAGLSQGVQPQPSPSPDGAPDPSAGAVPQTQLAMNGGGMPSAGGAPASPAPQMQAQRPAMDPRALMAVLANPWASPEQQQVAAMMLQTQANRPSFSTFTLPNGTTIQRNSLTGEQTVLQKPDPGQFTDERTGNTFGYDKNDPNGKAHQLNPPNSGAPLTQPLTPEQLSSIGADPTAKLQRNAKTGEITQIPGATGDDTYAKQLTEGLGKAHAQLANGVEEAQVRARDLNAMQGAIQRIQANGGTTGGLGQQEMLDLKKAVNNGAAALGITQPFGDLSDPEFLTKFNRQIAAAAASSGSNGGRVTNFAIQNMLKANPGLELTPQGNQRLIGIQQQIEDRNVAVGQSIRSATADAVASGQHPQPAAIEKIIRDYDGAHHIMDPITGQDLTANPSIKDYQNGGPGTAGPQNPGTNAQPQQGGAPATPKSKADYDALPHQALYIAPDGSTRRKP